MPTGEGTLQTHYRRAKVHFWTYASNRLEWFHFWKASKSGNEAFQKWKSLVPKVDFFRNRPCQMSVDMCVAAGIVASQSLHFENYTVVLVVFF